MDLGQCKNQILVYGDDFKNGQELGAPVASLGFYFRAFWNPDGPPKELVNILSSLDANSWHGSGNKNLVMSGDSLKIFQMLDQSDSTSYFFHSFVTEITQSINRAKQFSPYEVVFPQKKIWREDHMQSRYLLIVLENLFIQIRNKVAQRHLLSSGVVVFIDFLDYLSGTSYDDNTPILTIKSTPPFRVYALRGDNFGSHRLLLNLIDSELSIFRKVMGLNLSSGESLHSVGHEYSRLNNSLFEDLASFPYNEISEEIERLKKRGGNFAKSALAMKISLQYMTKWHEEPRKLFVNGP